MEIMVFLERGGEGASRGRTERERSHELIVTNDSPMEFSFNNIEGFWSSVNEWLMKYHGVDPV